MAFRALRIVTRVLNMRSGRRHEVLLSCGGDGVAEVGDCLTSDVVRDWSSKVLCGVRLIP